jgi:hypothetical protein
MLFDPMEEFERQEQERQEREQREEHDARQALDFAIAHLGVREVIRRCLDRWDPVMALNNIGEPF